MRKFKIPDLSEEKTVLKTIRIKKGNLKKVEDLSTKNNISINRIINEAIEFALENLDDENNDNK